MKFSRGFAFLAAAFLAYAGAFAWRSSFVVDGERYFCLFDDAMVSMRYARNFAAGDGLAWNPGGERVEGFTNPLWVFAMAGAHLLPLAPSKVSLAMQVFGALLALATVGGVWKLAGLLSDGKSSRLASLFAAWLTAFYYPLNYWAVMGVEVSALAALTTWAAFLALKGLREARFTLAPCVLMGVATLVRMDAAVSLAILGAFQVFFLPREARLKAAGAWTAMAGLCLGGQTLLRWSYYGELLPNTYYLKMTGYPMAPRVLKGLSALWGTAWRLGPPLLALSLGPLAWRPGREAWLPALLLGGQAAYSAYVGGDAWEAHVAANRFLCPAIPGLFALLAVAISDILDFAAGRSEAFKRRKGLFAGAFGAACLLAANIDGPGFEPVARLLLVREPLFTAEAKRHVERARFVQSITREDASVAVVWAGVLPYFAERRAIDIMGKTDPVVAKGEARINKSAWAFHHYMPGHAKWNAARTLDELRPDVVAQIWLDLDHRLEFGPRLEAGYALMPMGQEEPMYLRANSKAVRWELLRPGEGPLPIDKLPGL